MSMLTRVVSFDQVVTMTDAFLASVALLESKIVGVNDCVFLYKTSLCSLFLVRSSTRPLCALLGIVGVCLVSSRRRLSVET
jgi:hypothetical protein